MTFSSTPRATATRGHAPSPPREWEPVHRGLDRAAARHPGRPAVVAAARSLTFRGLRARSDALARLLHARGAAPETTVGLCLPRTADLPVGLFGILKSGAAYVPLDPAHPEERLRFLAADCGMTTVLTHSSAAGRLPGPLRDRALYLDTLDLDADAAAGPPEVDLRPGHPAYVVYTSGSTGRPKGVQITHGALTAFLERLRGAGIVRREAARVGWNASVSFDASVQQWIRACAGDTLVLLPEALRTDPAALARFLREQRVTDLDITPSHLRPLVEHLTPAPEAGPLTLLVGGEAVDPDLWQDLAALRASGAAVAHNLYGPTECTVDATAAPVEARHAPHLGAPLPGVGLYLLDPALRPVPDGEAGEICLTGTGLARGYLGRPALTAARFVPDPFAADGARLYRTGDLARRRPDGTLAYLGRLDDQIKLRGFRIEPGEIEAVLARHPLVAGSVVVRRDDVPAAPALVAYCRNEPSARQRADEEDLDAWVRRHLPDHMVPAAYVVLDSFPLNASGKVDRAALPRPEPRTSGASDRTAAHVAPTGPYEELVARAWCEVLGVAEVGADEDFFRIGGNSLLAIRVAARVRRATGLAIPMSTVFANSRLRALAAHLERTAHGQGHADDAAKGDARTNDACANDACKGDARTNDARKNDASKGDACANDGGENDERDDDTVEGMA
ncbi:amino acid adenylation domain-containing protein [Streptomyces naphthomycinicus]|uniref:amino acid adenylation domain-containing protein n=1 Tax=Streptomyces naphthomycinicus TaxID=2872625 RepID=UPI001CECFC4B|nr:amino acid adenylation domain-containing protein [Streptomyces sp. TML10]